MLAAISILLVLGLSLSNAAIADRLTTKGARDLSDANFKFTLDLYKRLATPGKNLVTSGVSVSTLLSMLLAGSKGRTHEELIYGLGYTSLTREDVLGGYPVILDALKGDGSYDLALANSVWVEKSFRILSDYEKLVRSTYGADVRQLNIPTGHIDINNWANSKTEGMIPKLLEEKLESDTVMVLLNAIFFKGTWATKFDNKTFESTFYNNDVVIMDDFPNPTTKMMKTKGEFYYTASNDLKAYLLDLPYNGDDVSMTIVLPFWGLADLEGDITSQRLQRAIDQMTKRTVKVMMPVFKIESSLDLNPTLKELGVREIFGNSADLSAIDPTSSIKVSKVFQKAKIEVDTEGTKAAAVSGAIISMKASVYPDRVEEFVADRPFMFLLRHKPTNTILFTGRYTVSEPFRK